MSLSAILNHFHLLRDHCLLRLFFERFDFRINDRPLPILYGYSMVWFRQRAVSLGLPTDGFTGLEREVFSFSM